jgi:hypothetical protein
MSRSIRRLVTGHNQAGKSVLISDANAHDKQILLETAPDFALINLWGTHEMPADSVTHSDPTHEHMGLTPSANGTVFRVVDFPPDATYMHTFQGEAYEKAWASIEASACADRKGQSRHPMMHCTATIDYGIVLEGEIYLILDDTEHLMKTGDVVVQRATNHAWSNRTNQICRMAFILVDAGK